MSQFCQMNRWIEASNCRQNGNGSKSKKEEDEWLGTLKLVKWDRVLWFIN